MEPELAFFITLACALIALLTIVCGIILYICAVLKKKTKPLIYKPLSEDEVNEIKYDKDEGQVYVVLGVIEFIGVLLMVLGILLFWLLFWLGAAVFLIAALLTLIRVWPHIVLAI